MLAATVKRQHLGAKLQDQRHGLADDDVARSLLGQLYGQAIFGDVEYASGSHGPAALTLDGYTRGIRPCRTETSGLSAHLAEIS